MTARARRPSGAEGFTLLELLLALAIVGALLAIAFGGLRVAISSWTRGEDRAELQQHTRGIVQILGRTLAGAYPYRGAYGEGVEKRLLFHGADNRVELVTQAAPFPSGVPAAFTAVVIAIEDDDRLGRALVIRQRVLPNREPFSEAAVVLRDPTIQELEIRYLSGGSDGAWTDSWDADSEQQLPLGIRVRLASTQDGVLRASPPLTVTLRTTGAPPK
jgi:general secretion pathway protein J